MVIYSSDEDDDAEENNNDRKCSGTFNMGSTLLVQSSLQSDDEGGMLINQSVVQVLNPRSTDSKAHHPVHKAKIMKTLDIFKLLPREAIQYSAVEN